MSVKQRIRIQLRHLRLLQIHNPSHALQDSPMMSLQKAANQTLALGMLLSVLLRHLCGTPSKGYACHALQVSSGTLTSKLAPTAPMPQNATKHPHQFRAQIVTSTLSGVSVKESA